MAENRPHYRHELKFLINAGDRELLARRLDVLMRRDPHAPEGGYKIRSLYFDDYWHTAYGEKLMGVTAMTKLLGKKKFDTLLSSLIEKPQGKPTLVPDSDKRKAWNPTAEDFKE